MTSINGVYKLNGLKQMLSTNAEDNAINAEEVILEKN